MRHRRELQMRGCVLVLVEAIAGSLAGIGILLLWLWVADIHW